MARLAEKLDRCPSLTGFDAMALVRCGWFLLQARKIEGATGLVNHSAPYAER
jgi:hypothetical protein